MKSLKRILAILAVLTAATLLPSELRAQAAGGEAALDTEDKRVLYAMGLAIAQNLARFNLTEDEITYVQQGVTDVVLGRENKVDLMQYGPKLQAFAQQRIAAASAAEKAEGAEFLEKKAAEEGAVKTDSGLIYKEITPGTGASPTATDKVKVHYRGKLRNGEEFDSSYSRNAPAEFPLNRVVACWTEGLQRMKVGGKSQLVCPSEIGYGDQGSPPKIPGGAVLVFEVELLEIVTPEE